MSKVTNVGKPFMTKVGKVYKIQAGDEFTVEVGGGKDKDGNSTPPKATLTMKKNGDILLHGIKVYIVGDTHVQIIAPMTDNN